MFTGLVEAVGEVVALEPIGSGFRLRLASAIAPEMHAGESLAVNGVCLTMVAVGGGELQAEIGPETVRVTNLGCVVPGSLVNLERPLRADARIGGHFVLGHVDGLGTVEDIRVDKDFWWFRIGFPVHLRPYLIPKGSVAVDGVSLTVAALHDGLIDIMIIPYTWAHTNFRALRPGDKVNLECDVLGKYVVRLAELGLFAPAAKAAAPAGEEGVGR
ncbi:MAG: riboflavin synthase [Vicinamibacterales bacterium]